MSVQQHGTYSQPLGSHFASVFYPLDYLHYTGDATDFPYGVYRLFTVNQTVDAVQFMVRFKPTTTAVAVL